MSRFQPSIWGARVALPSPGQPTSKNSAPLPKLFQPLMLRSLKLKNRVMVSPMCQYSSQDGFFNDWHLVNAGQWATGGVGLIILEATAVSANGRITPHCTGLWSDEHIEGLKRLVDFCHTQRTPVGLQLAHAGRKASTFPPFFKTARQGVNQDEGGWPQTLYGASSIPWDKDWLVPHEITKQQIDDLVQDWVAATKRADQAGVDFLEIHGAHGYLISSFLSPISNQRKDNYGGSFENRIRLCMEITQAVRAVWPKHKPLAVRFSSTEWVPQGWELADTLQLVEKLKPLGVDFFDCSSGGNLPQQKIPASPGFQVPFASAVRKCVGDENVRIGAVGLITEPKQAEQILQDGHADIILLARQIAREPFWTLRAAKELGVDVGYAPQYLRSKL